jgi:hypothetical protein
MPVGEDMFMYHGYSGPCPKPPIKVEKTAIIDSQAYQAGFETAREMAAQHCEQWKIAPYSNNELQKAIRDRAPEIRNLQPPEASHD